MEIYSKVMISVKWSMKESMTMPKGQTIQRKMSFLPKLFYGTTTWGTNKHLKFLKWAILEEKYKTKNLYQRSQFTEMI